MKHTVENAVRRVNRKLERQGRYERIRKARGERAIISLGAYFEEDTSTGTVIAYNVDPVEFEKEFTSAAL